MDPQVEIARIKRRRMGLLALAALLAVAGYHGWRAWSYERWAGALTAELPARHERRLAAQRSFLAAACASRTAGPSTLPAGLPEILDDYESKAEQRAALLGFRAQLVEALDPGSVESALEHTFERAPTFYLQRHFDPLVGLGAWEFTRHLYDARGKALLHFPSSGTYEGVLSDGARLREDLDLYDYVVSLDLPPLESPCEPTFIRALAGDFAARVLADIERAAGGAVRWLALRSEGRLAPLAAALVLPRATQIELVGSIPHEERGRAALLLSLLGDRYLLVEREALGKHAVAELERALEATGQSGNLELR